MRKKLYSRYATWSTQFSRARQKRKKAAVRVTSRFIRSTYLRKASKCGLAHFLLHACPRVRRIRFDMDIEPAHNDAVLASTAHDANAVVPILASPAGSCECRAPAPGPVVPPELKQMMRTRCFYDIGCRQVNGDIVDDTSFASSAGRTRILLVQNGCIAHGSKCKKVCI